MSTQVSKINALILGTDPASPSSGRIVFFAKSDGLYSKTSAGVVSKVSDNAVGKQYRATLLGADGSFTSATVAKNDLSAAIVWAYSAEGVYTGTLVGAFTANKTTFATGVGTATGGVIIKIVRTSADVVTLSTFAVDGTTPADFVGTIDVLITVDA